MVYGAVTAIGKTKAKTIQAAEKVDGRTTSAGANDLRNPMMDVPEMARARECAAIKRNGEGRPGLSVSVTVDDSMRVTYCILDSFEFDRVP